MSSDGAQLRATCRPRRSVVRFVPGFSDGPCLIVPGPVTMKFVLVIARHTPTDAISCHL